MKHFIFVVSVGLLCIFISCKDSSTTAGKAKDNLQVNKNLNAWHTVSMAFANGDPTAVDSVIADGYIDHKTNGDVKSRDSVKANITRAHAKFNDIRMETIKELADNDYGFFWMHFTANIKGAMGMPATPYDLTTVQVVRFKDGKAVEHWEYMEMKQLMKMMQQQGMNKKDSGKIKNKRSKSFD